MSKPHRRHTRQFNPQKFNVWTLFQIRKEYPQPFLFALKEFLFPKKSSHYEFLKNEPYSSEKKLVVFVHYAPAEAIAGYVKHHVNEFRKMNAYVVFVSTSPGVLDLSGLNAQLVIQRENVGLDFGSYATGWLEARKRLDLHSFDTVTFVNDSVFGPVYPLTEYFDAFAKSSYDMMGITDAFAIGYHIQSYFLSFKCAGHTVSFLDRFFSDLKYYNIHRLLVYLCERGLTQSALAAGLKIGAYIPYFRLREKALTHAEEYGYFNHNLDIAVNPMRLYWRVGLEHCRLPYVKINLLLDNPDALTDLDQVTDICAKAGYDPKLITEQILVRQSRV